MSLSSTPRKSSVKLVNMSSPVGESGPDRVYIDADNTLGSCSGAEEEQQGHPTHVENDVSSSKGACNRNSKIPYVTVVVLCYINLINYMDRFTVAGVLDQVQKYYELSDTQGGLIQTSFVICYMIMAPVFGYLGDRYNRTYIMAAGVLFWSATTLLGSFVPAKYFGVFIVLRALVGTGEASYSTIAPTIIADLFQGSLRSKMLAIFYFAIPIGSGLGYIIGSNVAEAFGSWQYALRVTPVLGLIATLLIFFVVKDPPRGESEGGTHLRSTTVVEDLIDLSTNYSFILSTAGFTCVAFATGALAWWAPMYFRNASIVYGHEESTNVVGLKFGIVTCVAGLVGVTLGSLGSQVYRKYNDQADPLVCATGVLCSAPLIFLGCVLAHKIPELSWFFIFLGEMFLCVNWPIVADILLYVVVPTRRSIAEAFQILFSHALGDAFSPYIIGAISDSVKARNPQTNANEYLSLQYALYITCFVLVLGGGLFLLSTFWIVQDREKCKKMSILDADDETSVAGELPNTASNNDQCQLVSD